LLFFHVKKQGVYTCYLPLRDMFEVNMQGSYACLRKLTTLHLSCLCSYFHPWKLWDTLHKWGSIAAILQIWYANAHFSAYLEKVLRYKFYLLLSYKCGSFHPILVCKPFKMIYSPCIHGSMNIINNNILNSPPKAPKALTDFRCLLT
jgi:hypothetical protein